MMHGQKKHQIMYGVRQAGRILTALLRVGSHVGPYGFWVKVAFGQDFPSALRFFFFVIYPSTSYPHSYAFSNHLRSTML